MTKRNKGLLITKSAARLISADGLRKKIEELRKMHEKGDRRQEVIDTHNMLLDERDRRKAHAHAMYLKKKAAAKAFEEGK